jgi:hypothetical protein
MQKYTYLTQLATLAQTHPEAFEALPETSIRELEALCNNGNALPQAFREYLTLAGKKHPLELDDQGEGLVGLQHLSKREIAATGQIVARPFVVVDVFESEYTVFFTDTTAADPEMFKIDPYAAMEGAPLIEPLNLCFTELISEKTAQWIR